jgi:prepilin-type N-terminal cleavage/methylation domain-containing protein
MGCKVSLNKCKKDFYLRRGDSGVKRGFSLLEMVIIVAIIGLLVAFLTPAVQQSLRSTRRIKDRNNLRQLVMAYKSYALQKGRAISISDVEAWCGEGVHAIHGVAAVLADEGILRDASVYFSLNDFRSKNAMSGKGGYPKMEPPKTIFNGNGNFNGRFYIPGGDASEIFPVAIEGFLGIEETAPISTTPLFFTRGAGNKGWDGTNPYGKGRGGFVAFLDGNVSWFDNFGKTPKEGKLVKYGTNEHTNNIREAVPDDAIFLTSMGIGEFPQ